MSKLLYICCISSVLVCIGLQPNFSFAISSIATTTNESSRGQTTEIRGTVRDSTGATLPGVSITVKNQNSIGTTTDLNGKYILDVPSPDVTLVFSIVGYESQEIPVRGQSVINVKMIESTSLMEEAVVVAFGGTQKRSELVGSVTSVNPKDLKVPSSNLTTAFAGRIAGMIAFQRSGEPGADNADFFIRGITTFGANKSPLILIDNIELTTQDLAQLQPDDIESFSIMKDAAATALYGARGANGVILVKTKSGEVGKVTMSVRFEQSVSAPTRSLQLADPITYMKMNNE